MSDLCYYRYIGKPKEGFSYGNTYIKYENKINENLYINGNLQIECLPNDYFEFEKRIYSIKDVVCVFSKDSSLKLKKLYSVYQIGTEKYLVFDENFKLSYKNKKYFVDENDWNLLTTKEQNEFIENSFKILNKDKIRDEKALQIEKEKKQKEIEQKEKLKTIEDIFFSINTNLKQNKIVTKIFMPKRIQLFYYIISIFGLILGILLKQFSLSIFCSIFIICNFILLKTYTKVKNKEEYEVDVNNYERLKFQNTLPIELLGKIKVIENEIIILNYKKVDSSILDLLKQSINLTIYVSTNEEYYLKNKEQLDKKLEEFLNNTLDYIKSLKDNRDMVDNYVGVEISKNIVDMIDKNNELFKSMIKDNQYFNDVFEDI